MAIEKGEHWGLEHLRPTYKEQLRISAGLGPGRYLFWAVREWPKDDLAGFVDAFIPWADAISANYARHTGPKVRRLGRKVCNGA
jgi:hypothetical protein